MEMFRKFYEIRQQQSECFRMVLLGKNEVDKSAVGNMILGRKAFKEMGTTVSEVQKGKVEDRNISVIDTPGFFNTELTDEDLQNEMMKSLSLAHPGPHVFLLIVRPETLTEDDVGKIVKKIQGTFGAQVLKFTLVLFIREQMSNREWMVLTLSKKCQELISYFRCKYHVINSESQTTQITLLEKIYQFIKKNDNQCYVKDINLKSLTIRKDKEQETAEEKGGRNKQENENKNVQEMVSNKSQVESQRNSFERMGAKNETTNTTDFQKLRKNLKTGKQETGKLKEQRTDTVCGKQAYLRIVMVGKSGAGKSATGNTILGEKRFREDMSSESVTRECQTSQKMVEDRIISVTDTPGLFDTSMSIEKLKDEIVNCVYMSAPGPHVFLLVIRLDVRFTEEEKNTVKWIQENFSADAMNYTMVLFTKGDQLEKPVDDFLEENKQIKDVVDKCKAGYHVFNNKDKKNQAQVTKLLEKIDRLMKENRGKYYTNEMYQEAQRQIEEDQMRQKEEEEKKRKEEEEHIQIKERERLTQIALKVGVGIGTVGAVVGTVALAATPAVIIPTALIAGGAAVTGGAGGKLLIDKVTKKTENTTTTSDN